MKLVFASSNKNKIKEIHQLLPSSIQILSLEDIGCFEDIPETANTIEGNAILKANFITEKYGFNCFADDSGLEVAILNGEPGVFSARYGGEEFAVLLPNTDHQQAIKVAELLRISIANSPTIYNDLEIPCTACFGVSSRPNALQTSIKELISEADKKLYRAKDSGRNTVID